MRATQRDSRFGSLTGGAWDGVLALDVEAGGMVSVPPRHVQQADFAHGQCGTLRSRQANTLKPPGMMSRAPLSFDLGDGSVALQSVSRICSISHGSGLTDLQTIGAVILAPIPADATGGCCL